MNHGDRRKGREMSPPRLYETYLFLTARYVPFNILYEILKYTHEEYVGFVFHIVRTLEYVFGTKHATVNVTRAYLLKRFYCCCLNCSVSVLNAVFTSLAAI